MIRAGRNRHRLLVALVALIGGGLLVLGLLARRPIPRQDALPAALGSAPAVGEGERP